MKKYKVLVRKTIYYSQLVEVSGTEQEDIEAKAIACADERAFSRDGQPEYEAEIDEEEEIEREHYNSENEHDFYTLDYWKEEVANENTCAGYNDWVHDNLMANEEEEEENEAGTPGQMTPEAFGLW